jgi:hypothetical protein
MAEGPIRGVVGMNLFNILIIGVIAVGAVYLYDAFIAGRTVAGVTLGRA